MMASAVVIRITALGGREICAPFAVTDGLALETIEKLKSDIRRSVQQTLDINTARIMGSK